MKLHTRVIVNSYETNPLHNFFSIKIFYNYKFIKTIHFHNQEKKIKRSVFKQRDVII